MTSKESLVRHRSREAMNDDMVVVGGGLARLQFNNIETSPHE